MLIVIKDALNDQITLLRGELSRRMWIYGFFFLLQAHGESYITAGVRTSTIMALRPLRAAVVVVVVVVEGATKQITPLGQWAREIEIAV